MSPSTSFAPLLLALAAGAAAKGVWTTPHDKFSSSIGVLGCKIDTNRVAYWPQTVTCDNICVKLSNGGRSVYLLRIDQSQGAYDISYDAWCYLQSGKPATAEPLVGGTVAMEYEDVDASNCASLIHTPGSKLPLSASNSMNFLSSCLAQPNSWVAKNHVLYNICDPLCLLGHDETCSLDLAVSNQASCGHQLGVQTKLTTAPVYDIEYRTGKTVVAGTGEAASSDVHQYSPNEGTSDTQPKPESKPQPQPQPQAPQPEPSPSGLIFAEKPASGTPPAQDAPVPTPAGTGAESDKSDDARSGAADDSGTAPKNQVPASPTLTSVTVPGGPKSTSGAKPSGPATLPLGGAATGRATVPALLLAAGTIMCSLLSAF